MILINLKIRIRPDKLDEWLEVARQYRADVSAEAGNRYFEWYRDLDDPHLFLTVECFEDADAGATHMGTAHVKAFMDRAPDLVAAQPEIVYVDSPDISGWGPMGEIQPR